MKRRDFFKSVSAVAAVAACPMLAYAELLSDKPRQVITIDHIHAMIKAMRDSGIPTFNGSYVVVCHPSAFKEYEKILRGTGYRLLTMEQIARH